MGKDCSSKKHEQSAYGMHKEETLGSRLGVDRIRRTVDRLVDRMRTEN